MEKESRSRLQTRPLKRPFDQSSRGPTTRPSNALQSKHPFTSSPPMMICGFCQKPGHGRKECRWANQQCLSCGSEDHLVAVYPFNKQRSIMYVLQHQKQLGGIQYPQVEELHFLHSGRCSSRTRGGQELVVEEARLST